MIAPAPVRNIEAHAYYMIAPNHNKTQTLLVM